MVLMLLAFPFLLVAIEKEDLIKCSQIKDKDKRLVCYDSLTVFLKGPEPDKKVEAATQPEIRISDSSQTEEIDKTSKKMIQKQKELISSLEKELKEIKTKKEPVIEKATEESFFARIVSVEYKNYRYYFVLDNGQKWSTSDTGKRAKLKPGQKIEITPGAFGSSYLKNGKGKFRLKKRR